MNFKIKRFLAFYIDIILIMVIGQIFCWFVIWGFDNPVVFSDLYLILVFSWAMLRDFTFQNKSFGKKIFRLSIYNSNGEEVYDWKQLLVVNFISTILFPISILTTFVSNQSLGDMFLGTSVLPSKEETKVAKKKQTVNKVMKYMLVFIPIIWLVIEFLLFQDLNFYSVRICFVMIVLSLLFLVLKVFIKNIIGRLSILIILGIALTYFSSISLFEKQFIQFTKLEDSLNYSYHGSIIQKKLLVEDSTLIFLDNLILQYRKKGGYWDIINPIREGINTKVLYKKDLIGENFIRTRKYNFTYKYLNDVDKTAVMITIEYGMDISLQDSKNTEFEKKEDEYISRYFGLIEGELDASYSITINEKIFYPMYH